MKKDWLNRVRASHQEHKALYSTVRRYKAWQELQENTELVPLPAMKVYW